MRLAQIARKVNTKPQEIRQFVKEKFDLELDSDPNTKLEEEQVNAIIEHFKVEEEIVEEVKEKVVVEEVDDSIDPNVDTDIDTLKEIAEEESEEKIEIPEVVAEEAKPVAEEFKDDTSAELSVQEEKPKKVVEIKHADPEAVDEAAEEDPTSFEEVEVDREAELIAAKVDKLEGIKVVGKIDLSEPEPEEEELPTVDAIEEEIDKLDGDVDTSEFPDMTESASDDEKEAIFAELDAQMDMAQGKQSVKQVTNEASEVNENIEVEDDENSIYKNARGDYRFTSEQKKNRENSLAVKKEKAKIKAQKEKKKRHYQENVAAKSKPQPKKKKKVDKTKKAEEKEAPKGAWQKFLNWLND